MRKFFVFLAVVLALLCFAMPTVASPPEGLPAIESVGYDVSLGIGMPSFVSRESPAITTGSGIQAVSDFYLVLEVAAVASILILSFATVAMLAGLMRGAVLNMRSDIAQYTRLGRSSTAGYRGWV